MSIKRDGGENAQLEMESIRLQSRCGIQIVDCTCKISRQRINLLHFPHHNGLACRPISVFVIS